MLISREFTFEAAHYLPRYHGKCERLHGHSYRLAVACEGTPDSEGMVVDFGVVKKVVNTNVIDVLDHTLLNDTIPNPTAELIAWWVWMRVEKELPALTEVRVWETATNLAILRRSDVEHARKTGSVPTDFELSAAEKLSRETNGWGCPRCKKADEVKGEG